MMRSRWGRTPAAKLPLLLTAMLLMLATSQGGGRQATAGAASEGRVGSALIGALEGPEVVTDPARFPNTFSEAPQLAAQVRADKLPPVRERVGQDPLVIKPVHEIGKYGGTWRRGFTGPADWSEGMAHRCRGTMDHRHGWDFPRGDGGPGGQRQYGEHPGAPIQWLDHFITGAVTAGDVFLQGVTVEPGYEGGYPQAASMAVMLGTAKQAGRRVLPRRHRYHRDGSAPAAPAATASDAFIAPFLATTDGIV
jgi:hypothetical protein